ncbi:MAG TPA: carboxypeptidase-like regulatory domain-containing protein [Acidimicrobiales bacterium]|jgi:hypothetical protein|nr:carboxypeptidase-like regulatory domain-containing protein [Acidimicrobiales bacterium]
MLKAATSQQESNSEIESGQKVSGARVMVRVGLVAVTVALAIGLLTLFVSRPAAKSPHLAQSQLVAEIAAIPGTTPITPPPPAMTPATTAPLPTTPRTPVSIAAPTTVPIPTVITGTVRDASGDPVSGAYVVGLNSLDVAVTNAQGQYSIPCASEPLVASEWLLPIQRDSGGGITYGSDSTNYGPPPTSSGAGYSFSGGATDADSAAPVPCGQTTDFVLNTGGNVDIQFVDSSGNPVTDQSLPIDNLYLPGLDQFAGLETAPLTSEGFQDVDQLAAGTLRIDEVSANLTCTGQGVVDEPSSAVITVTVVPGTTVPVICTVS